MAPTNDPLANPPERSSLSYRLGTRSDLLRQMLERLPWQTIPDGPHQGTRPLAAMASHSEGDPTLALLDAFAVVGDVLTFYQERIANEGFLRTATELRSVLELSRALGYELGAGLAAGTWLAFTVEDAPGAPAEVAVPPGVRVLSVPGQDERPQTFETAEALLARPEWNLLRPMTALPPPFTLHASELWIQGPGAALSPGDTLLFLSHARETDSTNTEWELRTVAAVTADPPNKRARVELVPVSASPATVASGGTVRVMGQRAGIFGNNAPDWRTMPQSVQTAYNNGVYNPALTEWPGFSVALDGSGVLALDNLYPRLFPGTWLALVAGTTSKLCWVKSVQPTSATNFAVTARCSAPELRATPAAALDTNLLSSFQSYRRSAVVHIQGDVLPPADPPLLNPAWGTDILAPFPDVRGGGPSDLDEEDKVALDRVVRGLEPGRTLLITGKRLRARVQKVQGVTIEAPSGVQSHYDRGDVLFVVARPVQVPSTTLTRWQLLDAGGFEGTADLQAGDVTLEPAADGDPVVAEVAAIASVQQDLARTTLKLAAPLRYWYDRATAGLYGNVSVSTHGETVREVLGSGDGSQANQRFTLRRGPLTWISDANPSGRRSTLEVRVDQVLWHEVSSFHDQLPSSRVYLTQRDDQGRTTVVFGDGVHGARPPTGQENVTATYRIGVGLDGEVGAGRLKLFQTRPLGLRAVTNPLPATGAEAQDQGPVARKEAPRSVLTLDRIVSVTDFETFAQTFAGIGKARAVLLRHGETQRLHVTLALADGTPAPADALILDRLRAAMDLVRDTTTPVELAGFEPVWFRVAASLRTLPDYRFDDVAARVRAALVDALSFDARAFAQGVSAAELVALIQNVVGVELVDLDGLDKAAPSDLTIPSTVAAWLSAEDARWEPSSLSQSWPTVLPAQLLLLDPSPRGLTLSEKEVSP